MKIVDRKTFLQMPKGTVFCKFPIKHEGDAKDYTFDISAPSILYDANDVDFSYMALGDDLWPVDSNGSDDAIDTLIKMQKHLGMEIPFEHWCGRDGLYEDDNVGFAIYSREEVQEMIDLLQQALIDGYAKHKKKQEDYKD